MRHARFVVGVVVSALLPTTPTGRIVLATATALSGTGCTNCTLGITTPDPLPDGRVGQAYFVQLRADATGGDCSRLFWVVPGNQDGLPPGMKLSEDGALDGTPTQARTYSFQITVYTFTSATAASSADTSRQYSLTILPP